MILNEDANALFRIYHTLEPLFNPIANCGESVLLDHVKQALFGFEIVVEAGQRHAGRAGEVAHRSSLVTLVAKHFGGMAKDLCQTAIKPGFVSSTLGAAATRCDSSGGSHNSNERSNYNAM